MKRVFDVLLGLPAAVAFLTRIPVSKLPGSEAVWRWSSAWFPLVGALLGALLSLVWLGTLRAGEPVAACLVVTASLWITGAFHEDALADTADALGGASDREQIFRILKDSRIGSYGAAALGIALLIRVTALASLGSGAPLALIVVGCLSRTTPVWLMAVLPYVTAESLSKSQQVTRVSFAQALLATLWPLILVSVTTAQHFLAPVAALALAGVALLVAIWLGAGFRGRAGGVTGDFLGATQQVSECAMLATLVWLQGGALR